MVQIEITEILCKHVTPYILHNIHVQILYHYIKDPNRSYKIQTYNPIANTNNRKKTIRFNRTSDTFAPSIPPTKGVSSTAEPNEVSGQRPIRPQNVARPTPKQFPPKIPSTYSRHFLMPNPGPAYIDGPVNGLNVPVCFNVRGAECLGSSPSWTGRRRGGGTEQHPQNFILDGAKRRNFASAWEG